MKKWAVNMKDKWNKYWSKIWFKLLIIAIGVLVVVGLLYCAGLRITYDPELKNDWDSISAYAAWFSVVVSIVGVGASFAAVWYAIQVPKQIAEKQNKISLFEKRLQCYNALKTVIEFSGILSTGKKYGDVQIRYSIYFGMDEEVVRGELNSCQPLHKLFEAEMTLSGGKFLFSKQESDMIDKIVPLLKKIYLEAILKNSEDDISESTHNNMTKLHSLCKKIDKRMHTIGEQYLQLS